MPGKDRHKLISETASKEASQDRRQRTSLRFMLWVHTKLRWGQPICWPCVLLSGHDGEAECSSGHQCSHMIKCVHRQGKCTQEPPGPREHLLRVPQMQQARDLGAGKLLPQQGSSCGQE